VDGLAFADSTVQPKEVLQCKETGNQVFNCYLQRFGKLLEKKSEFDLETSLEIDQLTLACFY